jgi:hypothetical protein
LNQTCQECSLDGPLPDLCFWCWFEIQHWPSWMELRVTGHNFENWPLKNHPCHVCFKLANWFQRKKNLIFFSIRPLGSQPPSKIAAISRHSFNIEPYGIWIVKFRCIRLADILKRAYLCQVSDTGPPEPLVYMYPTPFELLIIAFTCFSFWLGVNICLCYIFIP